MTNDEQAKSVELDDTSLEDAVIELREIEFDHDFDEEDENGVQQERSFFTYRLHMEDAYVDLPVTLVQPHCDLSELQRKADTQLYTILRILAEVARKRAEAPEVTFKGS